MSSDAVHESDLRHDMVFFGRTDELYQLVRNLQQGRHTLILGDKGIGKSRLMQEARWILSGRKRQIEFSSSIVSQIRGQLGVRVNPDQYKIISIEHPTPMGDCLRELAEKLFYNGDFPSTSGEERPDWTTLKKRLPKLGAARLQSSIFEGLSRADRTYLIFFESLDRISPVQQSFIETLLNVAVMCTAVVQMKENFAFKRIWASFTRITLEPLPESVSAQLVDYFFDHYSLNVTDRRLYQREILKASKGNPFHIKNMLWHGSRERYISAEAIRKLRQVEEGRYFNMGPIYIFGIAMFTMLKIFSVGSDDREFYIYFSALGFVAYLVFRVFRAFFIFRPQKYL